MKVNERDTSGEMRGEIKWRRRQGTKEMVMKRREGNEALRETVKGRKEG